MVAKSIDPQCIFDLVAIKPNGTVRLIDVKTKSYRKKNNHNIHRSPNEKQKQLGVELMVMDQKNIWNVYIYVCIFAYTKAVEI